MRIGNLSNVGSVDLDYGRASSSLQKSIARLSSGSRITESSDDAAGSAVSAKMRASVARAGASATNLLNADSFLRTQDSALNEIGKGITRMMELKTLSQDPTKDVTDVQNYSTEFDEIRAHLFNLSNSKFNGVDLFSHTGTNTYLDTTSDENGQQTVRLTQYALGTKITELLSDKSKLSFLWAKYPNGISETGNTVRGVLAGVNFTYTLTDLNGSPMNLNATDGIYSASTFPTKYNIPATDRTIANRFASTNTLNFDAPILNPTLLFASVGRPGVPVGITFDRDVTIEPISGVTVDSPSRVTGNEGFLIARLNGWVRTISFRYEDAETYCNFAFGAYTQVADEPLVTLSGDALVETLQYIANCRANNGAEEKAVETSRENLHSKSINMEAANSRIADVDLASELQRQSRARTLVSASSAMIEQSRNSRDAVLRVLLTKMVETRS